MPHLVFVQYSPMFGGSTISGYLITEAMRERGWDVTVIYGFDGPYVEKSKELGCNSLVVPHKSWLRTAKPHSFVKSYWQEMRHAQAFLKVLNEVKPDAVYINTLVSVAAAKAAKQAGIPVIWHIRELFSNVGGEMFMPGGKQGRNFVSRFVKKYARQQIAISRAVAENVLGKGDHPDLEIVPNAVQDEYYTQQIDPTDARVGLGLPTDKPIVGVPGTLRPMKGHSFFLETIPRILAQVPDTHFVISGTGREEYLGSLKKIVADLKIQDIVHFTGNLEKMHAFYAACDVVCIPSVAEPFGRTVIEAFAAGIPVVGTAVGGIQETIQDKENGLLVPYGATDELAQQILQLLTDEKLAKRLAKQARQDAENKYHERIYKTRIADLVENNQVNKP